LPNAVRRGRPLLARALWRPGIADLGSFERRIYIQAEIERAREDCNL
jgi:hypothetical protein